VFSSLVSHHLSGDAKSVIAELVKLGGGSGIR
jgi:hypothetical protein